MGKIEIKQVLMPVAVLFKACENCERLDITVSGRNLYGNDTILCRENILTCTHVRECRKTAEQLMEIMEKGDE